MMRWLVAVAVVLGGCIESTTERLSMQNGCREHDRPTTRYGQPWTCRMYSCDEGILDQRALAITALWCEPVGKDGGR